MVYLQAAPSWSVLAQCRCSTRHPGPARRRGRVTINYRLGLFGYLRGIDVCGRPPLTGNEDCWTSPPPSAGSRSRSGVRGDPENVTVFGSRLVSQHLRHAVDCHGRAVCSTRRSCRVERCRYRCPPRQPGMEAILDHMGRSHARRADSERLRRHLPTSRDGHRAIGDRPRASMSRWDLNDIPIRQSRHRPASRGSAPCGRGSLPSPGWRRRLTCTCIAHSAGSPCEQTARVASTAWRKC